MVISILLDIVKYYNFFYFNNVPQNMKLIFMLKEASKMNKKHIPGSIQLWVSLFWRIYATNGAQRHLAKFYKGWEVSKVGFFDFLQGRHARNGMKLRGLQALIKFYLAWEKQLSSCWRWPETGGATWRQIPKKILLVDFFIFYREKHARNGLKFGGKKNREKE